MPPAARVGDYALVPSDGHGCPACPHVCVGPATKGSCDVLVNGQSVLRVGDPGIHAACCGPNSWNTAQGSPTVLVNSLSVIRQNDPTTHCGGSGQMIMGSCNVIIGDSYCGSYSPDTGAEIAKKVLQMLLKQLKPSMPKPNLPSKPGKPQLPSKPPRPHFPRPDKPEKPTIPHGEKPGDPEGPGAPNLPDKPDMPEKPTEKPTEKGHAWEYEHGVFVESSHTPLDGHESKAGFELSREKVIKEVAVKKYGDEDNYLKLGMAEGKLSQGYKFDAEKGEHSISLVSLKGKVAGVDAQLKGDALSGLVSGKANAEAFSAQGEFTPLQVLASKEGFEAKSSLGAEANLVKGSAEGKLAITPKTVYDNTLGSAVGFVEGFFREPKLNKLPDSWDHGLVMGAKVEGGIGAAAKAEAGIKATAKEITASAEVKVGAGPMAGLKVFFGVK